MASSKSNKKVLFISNGHGEDSIGVQLALAFRQLLPHAQISAVPLVGTGDHYLQNGIALKLMNPVFPSGGFIRNIQDLIKDLKSG